MVQILRAELVANPGAALGESPLAEGSDNLRWIDMPAGAVWNTVISTGRSEKIVHAGPLGCIARAGDGGLLLASGDSVEHCSLGGSASAPIRLFEDSGLRLNDGKIDPWGRLVVGSACVDGTRERGHLYTIGPDSSVAISRGGITMSNGLDWSPDRRRFYHVDTPRQRIDLYEVDPDDGQVLGQAVFAEIRAGRGLPDGLTVDAEGRLWLAVWGSGCVIGFDPSGVEFARITVPVPNVTSCGFGGPALEILFITTAANSASDPDDAALGGALFACRTAVSGQPARRFGALAGS